MWTHRLPKYPKHYPICIDLWTPINLMCKRDTLVQFRSPMDDYYRLQRPPDTSGDKIPKRSPTGCEKSLPKVNHLHQIIGGASSLALLCFLLAGPYQGVRHGLFTFRRFWFGFWLWMAICFVRRHRWVRVCRGDRLAAQRYPKLPICRWWWRRRHAGLMSTLSVILHSLQTANVRRCSVSEPSFPRSKV